jgi:multiple antibiotic resistance protein
VDSSVFLGFGAEFLRYLVPLFVIASPLGAVPLFLAMTVRDGAAKRRRTSLYAALTCVIALTIAALVGEALFRFFGITIHAFRIAGSVLLFLYAMDMVQMRVPRMKTTDEEVQEGVTQAQVGVIPLGIPMLAGPGAMATAMVLRMQGGSEMTHLWALLAAILVNGLLCYAIFRLATRMEHWLGPVGMGIFIRVEGLILAAIAVQMAVSGIQGAFSLPMPAG